MDDMPATEPPAPDRPRKLYVLARLAVLFVVIVAGFAVWWATREPDQPDAQTLRTQVDALSHEVAQLRSTISALRGRQDDGDKVDKSMREQLLGLDQRVKLIDDSIANLADKRLSAHDALALDEAELLLTLGGERYALFHDATGAMTAYRHADTALSEVEDAAFATVRQSVAAEIAAFNAAQTADGAALAGKLAQLREQAMQWPLATSTVAAVPTEESPSRFARMLGTFVQVRHDDSVQMRAALQAPNLARELFFVDLREAQAAALARDDARYRAALASAHAELQVAFDPHAPAVAAVAGEFANLARTTLAPSAPPLLGTALRELRNLRATHALREAKPIARMGGEGK